MMPGSFMRLFHSLSIQFLAAGGLVMAVAAYSVGTWVSDRIERGVVQNSGASAAFYIESLIPSQTATGDGEMAVSDAARLALRKAFGEGILSEQVVTYNIWSEDGDVLDSYRPELRGRKYKPSEALLKAWSGSVVSQFQTIEVQADHPESTLGVPLLEVYAPIRDANTGQVLAVVEFYQRAEDLAAELDAARRDSWMLVLQIFGLSGALLFVIVHAGSRRIERQRAQLTAQLAESQRLSEHNAALRERVTRAAQRSTAQSEKIMQRIGQDLHDGVAQHLSLACLRLEGVELGPSRDAETVTTALSNAMTELRAISRGLALPDLATLSLNGCVARAIADHNKSFGSNAALAGEILGSLQVPYAVKLCVYRFLQEALSNAHRHAQATSIEVRTALVADEVEITVSDDGKGFEPQVQAGLRDDGGQGLLGLADRAATLNGRIEIDSAQGSGTKIRLLLPMGEDT
ncbi:hypothetical protein KX928_03390 [Roseobacter sp. YSTF-M11]|uniref:histidine kinase n=1 Tax=Roseobacter insulae TaxID=2859783 RepID=A0A9X1FTI0_9RHOB|nr:ATP-binding protein [Roseobacter insulae]MBW4706825.1 hypothetical protein [Roseobacter insulae]